MIIDKSELTTVDRRSPCISGAVVTPEYLRKQYLHLHWCIYKEGAQHVPSIFDAGDRYHYMSNHDKLLTIVRPFIVDLCSYLYTEGIPIESITVEIGGLGITIHLHVGSTQHIDIELLRYQESWATYSLIVYGRLYRAHGAHNLAMVLRGSLGKQYCSECHYSDEDTRYCGKGRDMYTRNCTGWVANTTEIQLS